MRLRCDSAVIRASIPVRTCPTRRRRTHYITVVAFRVSSPRQQTVGYPAHENRHTGDTDAPVMLKIRCTQRTSTTGPASSRSSSGRSAPISSAIRRASAISVSTICDSGTVLMTLPLTKICPLPLPEATPRSASRASPGPLTTHPMTATRSGTGSPSRPAVTSSASL